MAEIKLSRPQSIAYAAARKYRFLFICAGRRGGKTFLLRQLLLGAITKSNQNVWYVAPTCRMAKRLMWEPLKQSIPLNLMRVSDLAGRVLPYRKEGETDMIIYLINGSTISLFGAEHLSSLKKDKLDILARDGIDYCAIDEAALIGNLKKLYDQFILPALADKLGRLVMASTRKGSNYFWELCCNCFNFPAAALAHPSRKLSTESYFIGYSTAEGGQVSPSDLEDSKRCVGSRLYSQEFEVSFEPPCELVNG